jgi:hypothetical protein
MKTAAWMAGLIAFVNAAGIATSWKLDLGARPLAIALVATGCLGFVGLLALPQKAKPWTISEGVMRTTIAGTFVLVYLALLAQVAFWVPTSANATSTLPNAAATQNAFNITESLVTSFTTLMGAIIAFYFGASAYVQKGSTGGTGTGNASL